MEVTFLSLFPLVLVAWVMVSVVLVMVVLIALPTFLDSQSSPRKKWGVVVVCDYDVNYDYRDMRAIMMSFGLLDESKIEKSMRILSQPNTGMTISNNELCMSVVFISDVTNESEFWDTSLHELYHVSNAIIDYYGVPYESEDAAYLMGYLTKEYIEQVGLPCY